MKEYFELNNNYDKKTDLIISNNKDYKLSFLDKLYGGSEVKYMEIEREDLIKFGLTESNIENIDKILKDEKLKALFPTRHDIRINENGKIEISIKPINNINTIEDIETDIFY